jgi:sulfite exporter TauE/SafE
MNETLLLYASAASVAALHTLLGPDHYLPFATMARVGKWSLHKTLLITGLCGVGHVLGSVLLGVIGLSLGWAVFRLEAIESARGSLAGWLLIAFGLIYLGWGLTRAFRNRPHVHVHAHDDGTVHVHEHVHQRGHLHAHAQAGPSLTPWVLFTIFLFGPCEPLIPLLMYPAAKGRITDVIAVTAVFGMITIATMLVAVAALTRAAAAARFAALDRFGHAVAGFVILACGIGVKVGL